jgi:uncharacterized protein YndB with AHSA1/START domain
MKPSKKSDAGRAGGEYRREIPVKAPVDRLFDAIATRDGVRGWWTPLVSGSSERGGTLRLEFEGMDEHIDLQVAAFRRPTEVEWRVVEHTSLDEWAGTRIRFEVSPAGDGASTLAFQHVGLSSKLDCYDQCHAGWDHFLDSLVAFAERGKGAPFRADRRRA